MKLKTFRVYADVRITQKVEAYDIESAIDSLQISIDSLPHSKDLFIDRQFKQGGWEISENGTPI